jgi:DNA-binding IclR family transcriptional regulator
LPFERTVAGAVKEETMASALTFEDLKKKTVAELRELAKGLTHEAVQGYSQMNKEHLLPAVCKALGIETGVHHHVEVGFDKSSIKTRMKVLQAERDKALQAHDSQRLKTVRGELHALNHRLRLHMV